MKPMRNDVRSALLLFALVALVSFARDDSTSSALQAAESRDFAASYELLAFGYKTPGVCPACDRAKPILKRLARVYPIRFVYVDDAKGQAESRRRGVSRFPTFILARRSFDSRSREYERWTGSRDLERKIRAAFARVRVYPLEPRPRLPRAVAPSNRANPRDERPSRKK